MVADVQGSRIARRQNVATLVARHSRKCKLSQDKSSPARTPFDIPAGCDCAPSYFIDAGVLNGRKVRIAAGKNRKIAQRQLTKVQDKQNDGDFEAPKDAPFDRFADEWKASLKRPKANTLRSYDSTLDYAKRAFGSKKVRNIGAADIDHFLELLNGVSPSTAAKHLRVLGAVFRSAVLRGYATRNPIERLTREQRPQAQKKESAYFENDELPRILKELGEGLHTTLFLVGLKTGMRAGELGALTWGDVNLTDSLIRVRDNYTAGRLSTPKSRTSGREVDLTPDVVELLGDWWGECGKPGDDVLVFAAGSRDGHVPGWAYTRQVLYPAMERAGVPRVGPTGEKRTFHSLRHTYAKVSLENSVQMTSLSRQLGHSSVAVTQGTYTHFERSARKAEAAKLVGAFAV
jgi:integrase